MSFSFYKKKRLKFIFFVYWFLLAYIIAALVWWFIALSKQNELMTQLKTEQIKKTGSANPDEIQQILDAEKRKESQYIGEGVIFLLLILAGAVFIFRAVRRQLKSTQQQQNFMIAITHELKTPIAITKLNLETLQKRKLEETQQQRLIQNTIQEANRLNSLCNNMLLASQIEAGGYKLTSEEVNLSELVNECVNDFAIRFPGRLLERTIANDIFIDGDRLLLQMGINNLIDNAIKYSPKETPINISLEEDLKSISLAVKDEGKGIEANEKRKIFEKYYRIGNKATKGAKGTGLGLFLTKKIAGQHKASIFVTDNTPTGCIFTIRFDKTTNG